MFFVFYLDIPKKSINFARFLLYATYVHARFYTIMKRLIYILIVLGTLIPWSHMRAQAKKDKPFTVVIDAGHGGKDAGAVGKIINEKTLNLNVSLEVGKMIENSFPEVKVYYTRKTDVFLTLQERADFVNKHGADLFICVHTNAAENRSAKGAETFVLGVEKMESNLSVAMRENSVMLMESDYQTKYNGFDPKSIDSYIMFEMMQDKYMGQSLQFASLVQQEFSGTLHRADRGVRQAGFWVLHKSACPSVLVEMGFISNRDEEAYLATQKGRHEISKAIYTAFVNYKQALDKKMGIVSTYIPLEEDVPAPVVRDTTATDSAKVEVAVEPKEEKAEVAEAMEEKAEPKVELPVFKVQIFSTSKPLPKNDATFKGLKGCTYTKDGKLYKYTYGEETDYGKILAIQKELRAKFKDCFIVAFLGGKQISVKEARGN